MQFRPLKHGLSGRNARVSQFNSPRLANPHNQSQMISGEERWIQTKMLTDRKREEEGGKATSLRIDSFVENANHLLSGQQRVKQSLLTRWEIKLATKTICLFDRRWELLASALADRSCRVDSTSRRFEAGIIRIAGFASEFWAAQQIDASQKNPKRWVELNYLWSSLFRFFASFKQLFFTRVTINQKTFSIKLYPISLRKICATFSGEQRN